MKKTPAPLAALVPFVFTLAGCAVVPDDARPEVTIGAAVADKHMHRGMPQNRNWVAQGRAEVDLPTKWGDSFTVGTFGNVDLRNRTGRAWFPDGHDGRFSQIDYSATYNRSFTAEETLLPLDTAVGWINYNLPYGPSFPNGPRTSTNEVFLHAAADGLDANPFVQLHYDWDQGEGFYGRAGVAAELGLLQQSGETTVWLDLAGHAGYSGAGQSFWNYGIRDSGWADVAGTATLNYAMDRHTTVGVRVSASTILDSGIRSGFDANGIPERNLWVGVFVDWVY